MNPSPYFHDTAGSTVPPEVNPVNLQQFPSASTVPTTGQYINNIPSLHSDSSPSIPRASFWDIEYYTNLFNVDTNDVIERMKASIYPRTKFFDLIQENPDLYGPFWIPTTVLFLMFILSSFISDIDRHTKNLNNELNLNHLSWAAFILYTMVILWPTIAWFSMRFWYPSDDLTKEANSMTFVKWVCIYGYCLTILIPYSLLAVITMPFFSGSFNFVWSWLWIIAAFTLSTYFLIYNLWPYMGEMHVSRDQRTFFSFLLVGLHGTMFLVFKIMFY